jgi:pantoate--beta-alanine ligase
MEPFLPMNTVSETRPHHLDDVDSLRSFVRREKSRGSRIGFVPTMGNLHEGHLQLIRRAQELSDRVIVSIFVNPLQFGPQEDLDKYPRTLEADLDKLRQVGADAVYTPTTDTMYPEGMESHTKVEVPGLSDMLCGAHRPGHFVGVATVVLKLFNQVQPDIAVFGEKDYQQLCIIRKMVRDLQLPIRIEGVPTQRDEDGLALSSRNQYLSVQERQLAPELYRTLCRVRQQVDAGSAPLSSIEQEAADHLNSIGFSVDYLTVRRQADLSNPSPRDRELVVLAAARLGSTRLIDNLPWCR